MLFYWVYLYYKTGLYPLKPSRWNFETHRHVPLLYYSSIIHLISRTIPFIVFTLCWQARGLVVKGLGCLCFFYGFSLTWKTSSLLTMALLILGYLYVFYNKIFKQKTIIFFIGCLFLAIICRFSVRKNGVFERVLNSNIGDILAINYYDDNPQGFKFINNFIRKRLGDRKQVTFAEEWYSILVKGKNNYSTGIGCIAASWVNFNCWGGGILFIFGYIVGCLEVFFATRKKFLIY